VCQRRGSVLLQGTGPGIIERGHGMKKGIGLFFAVWVAFSASAALVGDPATGIRSEEIKIWDGPAPGSEAVTNIPGLPPEYITPTLTVQLPPVGKHVNGAFILIVPGGGYKYCSAVGEGMKVAEKLLAWGVGAGVLRYRRNMFEHGKPPALTRVYEKNVALEDAMRSMRIVRAHAGEWGLKEGGVGIMGFSAGGHISATMAVHPGPADLSATEVLDRFPARPDYVVLAYSLISMAPPWGGACWRDNLLGTPFDPALAEYYSCQKHVTADTPPCFIVCASDDFTLRDSLAMYEALGEKKVPREIHLFERGGHGYGMTKPGLAVTAFWPDLLHAWLQGRGVLP